MLANAVFIAVYQMIQINFLDVQLSHKSRGTVTFTALKETNPVIHYCILCGRNNILCNNKKATNTVSLLSSYNFHKKPDSLDKINYT